MELDERLARQQHCAQRRPRQRPGIERGCRCARGHPVAHHVEQRARTALLAQRPRRLDLAGLHRQRDGAVENLLDVAEQAGLEFFAAKAAAHRFRAAHRFQVRLARTGLVVHQHQRAADTLVAPQAVIRRIRAAGAVDDVGKPGQRRRIVALRQIQAGQAALVGGSQYRQRGDGLAELAVLAARLRQLAVRYVGIGQRDRHQRAKLVAGRGFGLAVMLDRLGVVAGAHGDVAEGFQRRPGNGRLGAIGARQRRAGVFLGALEVAGVTVGDRQVTLGGRHQAGIVLLLADHQRLAGGLQALAKFPPLGQRNRLAAILEAVELDPLLLVQQPALVGQRPLRLGVLQPRPGRLEHARRGGRAAILA